MSYALSRPAIEFAVRKRLRSYANISLRDRCRVSELLASPDGTAVTGVQFEEGGVGRQDIPADLVVDASGHGAPTLAMLKKRGLPLPEETVIGIDQDYATAVFHIPSDAPSDWKSVFTIGGLSPTSARGALLWPIEGNRWILSFGGRHGDAPPGDVDGFMAFARSLRTPTIYNAVKNARLDGKIVQGLAKVFFEKIPTLIETPWNVATFDFMHPATRGQRPADFETRLKFAAAFTKLAADDPDVHRLTAEVQHLLKPRSVYREPALLQRVLPLVAQG
jgi:hypothetical protein